MNRYYILRRCNDHYIMVRALNKLYDLHID